MPRPLRIQYSGAWYHVFNRGARRQVTYSDHWDRSVFLQLLSEISGRFNIEIHAYCLMGNHYHMLVRTPEANLGVTMQYLMSVYTRAFNRHHELDGALFRGRYQAILIDSERYLATVSRYIHRNPLEAGLTQTLDSYAWSSYPDFVGVRRPPAWLHIEQTVEVAGGDPYRYRGYVEGGSLDGELAAFYGRRRIPAVLGSDAFKKQIALQDGQRTPQEGRIGV